MNPLLKLEFEVVFKKSISFSNYNENNNQINIHMF